MIQNNFFPKKISAEQVKDSGLALVLVFLLAGCFTKSFTWIGAALVLLLIDMIVPSVYWPFARLWIGISTAMGKVMSKVLLAFIFFLILTPIGMMRRLSGADPLQCRRWKDGEKSVFRSRNHTFEPNEMSRPY